MATPSFFKAIDLIHPHLTTTDEKRQDPYVELLLRIHAVLQEHGPHVQHLRFDPQFQFSLHTEVYDDYDPDIILSRIIHLCPNIAQLRVETSYHETGYHHILSATLDLLKSGTIRNLMLLDAAVIGDAGPRRHHGEDGFNIAVLSNLLGYQETMKELQHLHVAINYLPMEVWKRVKAVSKPQLRSLVLRGGYFSSGPFFSEDAIYNTKQLRYANPSVPPLASDLSPHFTSTLALTTLWSEAPRLTSLELFEVESAHAEQITRLVPFLPSLRRLMVAVCGDIRDFQTPAPLPGWSADPNSLPNVHAPLDLVHIEHALEWEVLILGLIPTRKLVLTNVADKVLVECFVIKSELYVGCTTVSVAPIRPGRDGKELKDVCGGRGIEVIRDARRWRRCKCRNEQHL